MTVFEAYITNLGKAKSRQPTIPEQMKQADIEVAGEFLEMAARLIYIKSAALLPKHEADELKKELQTYVKKETAPYKYPRVIEFVDSLPKTVNGKIRRTEIRANDLRKLK